MTTPTEAPRDALPELPEARTLGYENSRYEQWPIKGYDEEDMRAYAQSALESERQAHAAEVERLRGMLVWAMDNMGMRDTSTEFVAHVLRRGGTGDYDDCATFIDQAIGRGRNENSAR